MSTLKNGEFGIDLDKEKILWTDRKRHTIFSLPLSFTKYTLTETKLIIQRGCFNLREDEIQLYRVRDIAFKQNFYERLCRVGSIHLCSTDAMTPEIDIRRIKNPRDVKEVLSKTIEARTDSVLCGPFFCLQRNFWVVRQLTSYANGLEL